MIEMYQPIVNFGILVVIAGMYLTQTPKMIEKVTKVVESNTNAMIDNKAYHQRLENFIVAMKDDIEDIKRSQNSDEILTILQRLEKKVDDLGK